MSAPRVLVVEDNRELNEILRRIVSSEGYQPFCAYTGRKAMEMMREQGAFDLILLDVMLPDPESPAGKGLDGLEVCRRVKSDPVLADTMVFMVTVKDQPDDIVKGIDAGADDYITKPFNTTLLLAKTKAMLRIKHLRDELREKNQRLEELATTDDLTGAHNHRFFMDRLEEELRRGQRYGTPFALLMLDLDGFKAINDAHGHRHGDAVLRETSQVMGRGLRATDSLARYGGDEFAVLLPQTDRAGAVRVAEEILSRLSQPLAADGREHRISASIGMLVFPSRGCDSADDLINAADAALYRSKSLGGNRLTDASTDSC
jgi:diguanylate cyclase (GGDEF)-like protein